jgi:uncharacterized protein YdeI (YjbR/CyaY-like superfamily)
MPKDDLPQQGFATQKELEAWLDEHGATSRGIWLKIAKKGGAERGVTYVAGR